MSLRTARRIPLVLMALLLFAPGFAQAKPTAEVANVVAVEEHAKIVGNKSETDAARHKAAVALLNIAHTLSGDDRASALKPLTDVLASDDGILAAVILQALVDPKTKIVLDGNAQDKGLSSLLVGKLRSENAGMRAAAEAALRRHVNAAMEDDLKKLAADAGLPKAVREIATKILAEWSKKENKKFRETQTAILNDTKKAPGVRQGAAVALLARAHGLNGAAKAAMIRPLLDGLNGKDASLIVAVLQALANTGLVTLNGDDQEKTLSAAVVEKLGYPDKAVRDAARLTVSKHRNRGMEGRLIRVVGNRAKTTQARAAAATIIGSWQDNAWQSPAAVNGLVAASHKREAMALRIAAVRALGRIPQLTAVPVLIAGLRSKSAEFRQACAGALAGITENESLGDSAPDWEKWWKANKGKPLNRIRLESLRNDIRRIKRLLDLLAKVLAEDKKRQLRVNGVKFDLILEVLSNNHLTVYFQQHNAGVIIVALEVLKNRSKAEKEKSRGTLNKLIALRKSAAVRLAAATFLEEGVGDRSSVAPLVKQIGVETDATVRVRLVGALRKVVGPADAGKTFNLFRSLLADANDQIREYAADALGRLGKAEGAPALMARIAVKNGKPLETAVRVRFFAVKSLGLLKAAASVQSIIALLAAETDPGVRQQCIRSLGAIGGDAARAAIVGAMESKNEKYPVRIEAIAAAEAIGLTDLAKRLEALAIDPANARADALRLAVVSALGRVGSLATRPRLTAEIKAATARKKPNLVKASWDALLAICRRATNAGGKYKETVGAIKAIQTELKGAIPAEAKNDLDGLLKQATDNGKRLRDQVAALARDNVKAVSDARKALKKEGLPAVPYLIDALADPNAKLKAEAHKLLQEITGQKIVADPAKWLDWYKKQGP